jgi:hypothetical protein
MVVLNPGLVIGPTFNKTQFTSGEIILKFLKNDLPGIPELCFSIVDVMNFMKI